MRLTEEELKELNRQRTARSARGQAECLTEESLFRIAEKKLSRKEHERAISHLRGCSDCAREYRIVRLLKPWAAEVTGNSVTGDAIPNFPKRKPLEWMLRNWGLRSLSPNLALTGAALVVLGLITWLIVLQNQQRHVVARLMEQLTERDRAIASATESLEEARRHLAETARAGQSPSTGGSSAIAELRRQMTEISRPQLNTPIVDLDPGSFTRGSIKETTSSINLPAGANFFTLILHVAGQKAHSNYALELSNDRGRLVWRGERLEKSPDNTFTISFSRLLLPGGKYQIKLYGFRDGKRELVESYAIVVRYL